ncbi:maestro heat-like repeat-containing protein family member 1 isoform X2 [Nilaparvata lugens]|nr:maestro heat-like repeat-containing protein family member 1 isoform X2 [Nilaparvata lugens]
MENIVKKFQPKVVPHYALIHTLANIAIVNVKLFVPYIKGLLSVMIPLFPNIRYESIRQVFAFALGRFCEAVLEYWSTSSTNNSETENSNFCKQAIEDDIFIAFDTICSMWIQARESKIVESCVVALGPMFAVLKKEKLGDQTSRLVNLLLGLYRKGSVVSNYVVTQCLAHALFVAPSSSLEVHVDVLLQCLGSMVIIIPDYKNPQTVKNHSEVLRCYDRIANHFRDRLTDHLLRNLNNNSDRDRVEGLIVTAHLLSGTENALLPRLPDIVTALRSLIPNQSMKVKKALLKAIVALMCRGNVDNCSDFIEFIVKHCCPPTNQNAKWDDSSEDLLSMCASTVFLLCSTVAGVERLMWSVLQRLLLLPEYEPACTTVAKSLAHLAAKIDHDKTPDENAGNEVPEPQEMIVRILALLGSPLHGNRGPHLLNFLMHFSTKINDKVKSIWDFKIPQLVNYLEVSEWSEDEWDSLLLEFVASTFKSIDDAAWMSKMADQLTGQLKLLTQHSQHSVDERATVLKCLALFLCNVPDKEMASSNIDVIFSPLKSFSLTDSKACAQATGIVSRVHLELVLARLESLAASELNKRSSRLLGLMKDARTDAQVECARITLLRCYAQVAAHAEPARFLARCEPTIMQWLIKQLNYAKEGHARDAALQMLCSIADALDRNKDVYKEQLKSRGDLLNILHNRIDSNPSPPDSLLLRATASLVKLPPPLGSEARSKLLKSAFDKVLPADCGSNPDERVLLTQHTVLYLGKLVEEVLLSSVTPANLDDIACLLEPWLVQANIQQRIAAVTTLKTALFTYLHNMRFTYDAPSKFAQSGQMLGKIVVRCMDQEVEVRKLALHCARLILLITAKYEGLAAGSDCDIEEKFQSIAAPDGKKISEELAQIVAAKLPHFQLNHFTVSLLDGLTDHEYCTALGVAEFLVSFLRRKGGELYHHISEIIDGILYQIGQVNSNIKAIAVNAVLELAKHHPKGVISTLLSQALPFSQGVCQCWRILANDLSLAADVLDKFLRLGSTTPLTEDDTARSPNSSRPPIATLLPLAAICALREMFLITGMRDLAISRFPEVFTLYLNILVTYIGVSPPINTPSFAGKAKFIPNREAYKLNPAGVVKESFFSFLTSANCGSAADSLMLMTNLLYEENYDSFLSMMPSLTRSVCGSLGHLLPKILTCLSPYYNSSVDAQRIAFMSFHAEVLGLQCASQPALIDNVVSTLKNGMTDPSPHVRRLSLKGLAYISNLDPDQRERHCEIVLTALIDGLDDHETINHSELALQAMTGLSQVLPTVQQADIQNHQVAIALRIKPYFEKESCVWLRMSSLRLLGELAQWSGAGAVDSMPAFQEQVRSNLVCLLMHLSEADTSVVKACKFTLRNMSGLLEAEKVAAMLTEHLIDEATLQYQEFLIALSKLLIEEMPDQVPTMVLSALPYSKSAWPEIRGNSALFISLMYSNSPQNIRDHMSLDSITNRLTQLIKDSEKDVRSKASNGLSILFVP